MKVALASLLSLIPLNVNAEKKKPQEFTEAVEVANLESAVRTNRTRVELLRAELTTMREKWKITDPEPEKLVIMEPKEARPVDFEKYVKRKGEFLKAKVESEKSEQALKDAKAKR